MTRESTPGRRRCWVDVTENLDLGTLDAGATPGFRGEEASAREQTEVLRSQLVALQARLYAESRQRLLVVLQAMDTGGKDGVIRKVFSGVNPQGVRVARFERPSVSELARDYLWRVHAQVPAAGEITIFNRSHYEDVLVVRVNSLVPRAQWKRRYRHIRGFERMLVDEGTTLVKIFLHIDRDEQARRLQARLDDPERHWKFDPHDIEQRRHWDAYMAAFREAMLQTHRPQAPWYIIPANHKWYRDWAVMNILVRTLGRMNPQFPATAIDPASIRID
jgi:PPK2 family polyphosphate:nucleotide phosphotransferase